jgi:penicillin-binding protein 2
MKRPLGLDSDFGTPIRQKIFLILSLSVLGLFIIRLGYLQIVQGNVYRLKAETQAIKQITVDPFRGNIYDRNGKIIVHNAPAFSVTLTPSEFRLEAIPLLASILQVDTSEVRQAYEESRLLSRVKPNKIYRDADFQTLAALEENHDLLPGVDIVVEFKRLYETTANMAHSLGYTRQISEQQLKTMGNYYIPGDIVGYSGMEKTYENYLRGGKGIQMVAVSATGQKVSSFQEGKNDILPEEGFDLHLGLDMQLQELAEKLLDGRNGAIVALNPNNGEILAFTSKPDFDLRDFSGRTSGNTYSKLLENPDKPLFNRATLTAYPPGSTWKMLMAAACLQEGVITSKTTVNCTGGFTYGGRTWKCHGGPHGVINVQRAIHVSCNAFFNAMGPRLGIEKFTKYGRMFGFGEKTYVDISEDASGLLPSYEYYKRHGLSEREMDGRLVNLGIGQGELGVTPVQMAVYCAALANKGTIRQPHFVSAIFNRKTKKLEPIQTGAKTVKVSQDIFDLIQNGMYDVVNTPGGTALSARVEGISVCGKTGTAQNPHGLDHAWFICFAPKEKPQIAMCVMVENAGFGGVISAPIAQKMLQKFFYPKTEDAKLKLDTTILHDPSLQGTHD